MNSKIASSVYEADCSACAALCCVALSFDRSDQFGHDKLAGQPCHHLGSDFRCRIHARREELGYEGCEAFDCLGAGQRATALYAASNWQRDPAMARRMQASFALLLRLQEMRQALDTAESLNLPADLDAERLDLHNRIADAADRQNADIHSEHEALLKQAEHFLGQVKTVLAGAALD